jgi:hypothetical protein
MYLDWLAYPAFNGRTQIRRLPEFDQAPGMPVQLLRDLDVAEQTIAIACFVAEVTAVDEY